MRIREKLYFLLRLHEFNFNRYCAETKHCNGNANI